MEAVPAYAPALTPVSRDGIGRRLVRDRGMEGRVENSHMQEVRERRLRLADRVQSRLVVEWSEGDQRLDRLDHGVIHDNRLAEGRAAVDDPMPNCIRRLE